MRLEWTATGLRLRGLRGRDRDIGELQFHGAKGRSFVCRAKVKELRSGNRVVEEESEVYLERREQKKTKVAEKKASATVSSESK